MTAAETRKISEDFKDNNLEKQWNAIIEEIRMKAEKGQSSHTLLTLYPENKARLEEYGYSVKSSHDADRIVFGQKKAPETFIISW